MSLGSLLEGGVRIESGEEAYLGIAEEAPLVSREEAQLGNVEKVQQGKGEEVDQGKGGEAHLRSVEEVCPGKVGKVQGLEESHQGKREKVRRRLGEEVHPQSGEHPGNKRDLNQRCPRSANVQWTAGNDSDRPIAAMQSESHLWIRTGAVDGQIRDLSQGSQSVPEKLALSTKDQEVGPSPRTDNELPKVGDHDHEEEAKIAHHSQMPNEVLRDQK